MSHSILKDVGKKISYVENGSIVSPKGFQAAGIHAGFRYKDKDLGVILSLVPATTAAVYTMNQIQAAPITMMKRHLAKSEVLQAFIVNSGNANACTGSQGLLDAERTCQLVADKFNFPVENIGIASTGVIGENLPMELFPEGIEKLTPSSSQASAKSFSEAILTTDTCTKTTCYEAVIHGKKITVAGVAKGSGMIDPNMATMLSFITTDAYVEADALQKILGEAVNETFNCITVDGDMSTNDMVCVLANGEANNECLTEVGADWLLFREMVFAVSRDLAKMIARDGEGATRLIEVLVQGAKTKEDAKGIGKSVVGSALVKTAVFGADPNWGRIIAAIGYSGVSIHPEEIDIAIGSIHLMRKGSPCEYNESDVTLEMKQDPVQVRINVHMGKEEATTWGCDLTYDYVKINASYRT